MKLKKLSLAVATALAAVVLPCLAKADTLSISLDNPVQTITTSGATLSFSGSVTNTGSDTEYFSGDSLAITFGQTGYTFDDSSFQNNLFTLAPNDSYNGSLFSIVLPSGVAQGNYIGTYYLYGGTASDFSGQDPLGSALLQVNVNAPATAATPEPSSFLLLGTAGVGLVGMVRRRFSL